MSIGQRLARVFRVLSTLAAVLVIVWSVAHVTHRVIRESRDAADVEVRVLFWGDADEVAIVETMADAFREEHPGVAVELIHVDAANFGAKLKTMAAANDPPDVFYVPQDNLADYASLGMLEPVGDDLAASGVAWADDFFPVLIDGFSYDVEAQRAGGGELWALPKDFTPVGLYVNVDLFERAGVPVPTGGWTWDDFERAARRISELGPNIYGANLNLWPATLQAILWSHGGDVFEADADGNPRFDQLALAEPAAMRAMERIRRLRLDEGTVYNATGIAKDGGQEFFTGRIGMNGPVGRWMTPRYRGIEGFEVDFVPLPHEPGVEPTSPIFATGWGVSPSSPNKEAAIELAMFLAGPEGQRLIGELGLAVPALESVARSDAFLQPGRPPANTPVFLELADAATAQRWPRERELADLVNAEQSAALQMGSRTVAEAVANVESRWEQIRQAPLTQNRYPRISWPIIGGGAAAIALVAAGLVVLFARRQRLGRLDAAQERSGFAFISPWIFGFVVLTAGPMLLAAVLALCRWSAVTPLGEAEFVGLANFTQMLRHDPSFWQSLWVTGYYVLLAVPLGQVAALAVALLMNASVRGIGVFRTIFFVPSVITGVALGTLWLALLNNDYGLINRVLDVPLGWIGGAAPDWFGRDAHWAAIPAFVLMSLWGVGSAMVIYLAGLKTIPTSLYEAATVDGASAWHKLLSVTLPMLSPLIFFNLVMGIIGSFQVFTQAFVMTGRGPDDATLFYVLNLYLQAFEFHHMGYASALAWVLFVLILAVTLLAFRGSRGLVHYEGLKA